MKILFLSAFLPHGKADSAGVLDAYYILKELAARYDIILVSFTNRRDEKFIDQLQPLCKAIYTVRGNSPTHGFSYYLHTLLSLFSRYPAIAYMANYRKMRRIIKDIIMQDEIDIIHTEFTQMAHYIKYFGNLPCVLDESDIAYVRRSRFTSNLKIGIKKLILQIDSKKLKKYEIDNINRYDAVLVRTNTDKETLKNLLPIQRFDVFPPWIDMSITSLVSDIPTKENLIFYGAMWRSVNSEAAIYFINNVFPHMTESIPSIKFFVVGSNPPWKLRRLSSKNTAVTGFVDNVAQYYNKSAIAVIPLLSGSGIKGKIIQALACGRPVVTTSIGAEGIPASENEGLFVVDTLYQMTSKILWLLKDKNYLNYSGRAKAFVQRFYDWSDGVNRLEQLYKELRVQNNG